MPIEDENLAASLARTFSRRLRVAQKQRGYTTTELARAAGLDVSALCRYMKGTRMPSIISLVRIAAVLETDLDYFFAIPRGLHDEGLENLSNLYAGDLSEPATVVDEAL